MIAANVVDFPDPVGPVTKTSPLCMSTILNIAGGKLRLSISKIVVSRQLDGQLDDSNLSKGEVFLIKRSFLNVWKRIRHRRIQYPTNKNNTFS